MKQRIIDQMESHLGDGRWAKSDFCIDRDSLADYDGKFFWMSRENGTSLAKISIDHICQSINNKDNKMAEANRMAWFQDFYVFMASIMYWNDPKAKIFYCDGDVMFEITNDQAKEIYDNLLSPVYRAVKRDFRKEDAMSFKRLPIKFNCSLSKVKEALRYAESINDSSLLGCFERIRHYRRSAVEQYIQVSSDFTKHGFTFAEMVNGECRLVGGIIMHEYETNNHWSIHT